MRLKRAYSRCGVLNMKIPRYEFTGDWQASILSLIHICLGLLLRLLFRVTTLMSLGLLLGLLFRFLEGISTMRSFTDTIPAAAF